MSNTLIYHNPSCSKSREALALLQSYGIQPTVINYLETPFTHESLSHLLKLLSFTPRQLIRPKEEVYRTLTLDQPNCTDDILISAMVKYPRLIERPIVIHQGKAIIARPPELVLTLLNEQT